MNYIIISPMAISSFVKPFLNTEKDVEKIYFCILDPNMKSVLKDMNLMENHSKLEVVFDPWVALNKCNKKSDIVFIDDIGIGDLGDHLRSDGWSVIGGTSFTDKLENDRTFGTDFMGRLMKVPESFTFTDFDEAIKFAKAQPKEERFVFKPHDGMVPKEYTFVAKDINDLVEAMITFKGEWKWEETFQLQRFIKGVEVDFSGYFNGTEWLKDSLVVYFENKPFMNDDIGPATGGAVAISFAKEMGSVEIMKSVFEKLAIPLKKVGYKGQLSFNTIVSEDDKLPYFLEICGRTGYPSFQMDMTLLWDNKQSVHKLFTVLSEGKNPGDLFPAKKTLAAAGLLVSVPPAPKKYGVENLMGEPISWDPKWFAYFFPYYVMYDKKQKQMVLAGIAGDCLVVTCADATIPGGVDMIYNTYLPTLKLNSMEYRTDLGKSATKRLKLLKEWGVLT